VALPGINDGELLHQSIRELAALYPIVQTIAVVPVGLTKYRFEGKRPQTIKAAIHIHETPEWINENWERQPLWDEAIALSVNEAPQTAARRPASADLAADLGYCSRQIVATDVPMRVYRPEEAAQVVDLIEEHQARFRAEFGNGLVYPSDEFYLLCGREMPPAERYDGMPQYSNGVGMTRDFLDGWAKAQRRLPARMPRPTELTIVCATLIAPTLQRMVDRLNRIEGLNAHLLPVVNQFFGEMVTVSGLLMAQDVIPAIKASAATRVLLPRVMFDHTGKRTIDEYSLEQIAAEIGIPVAVAGEPDQVLRYVRALARDG
jgi:NifB/MoaA-like Fe-S oxidoreductase